MSVLLETEETDPSLEAPLNVYLLGTPGVAWIRRTLTIPRRQARALLYHLATRLQPVPREQLCGLFWPNISETTAHRNLSHLLTHLRRALPIPEALFSQDEQIGLNPQCVWSDAATFERLCHDHECRGCVEALQQVVDLYQGPFLSGFSLSTSPEFEIWAAQERRIWERLYLEALASLVEEWTATGNYEKAIGCAQRYLAANELAEAIHRRLIGLYAASGDRSAALRQFEQCVLVLERELGVSPLPETRAAYLAVLEGRTQPSLPAASPSTWMTLPSLAVPLVGREAALDQLQQAYQAVQVGQGRMILISGEAGMGKSRLIEAFVTDLRNEATIVAGSGHETEQDLPYWPLIEALRPHLRSIDSAPLGLEPDHLAQLVALWPGLPRLLPSLKAPTVLKLKQERVILFQALFYLLTNLATQPSPLILCLDDLHWADQGTLAWLSYLARRLDQVPLLVLGTYRTEDGAALAALRTELFRLGRWQELSLGGLSPSQILCLSRQVLGQPSGIVLFSRRLHRGTGGNPFFVLEILRTMREQTQTGQTVEGEGIIGDCDALPLPDAIRQAIRACLSQVSAPARQVLEAGATLGGRFGFERVWAVSGRQEREVVEALEELSARRVILERDGRYRFNPPLIRAVVCGDLSYGRRRMLEGRVAKALSQ